jgi:hypothetical protein
MKGSSRVALALAAGYVLGRRHKLRTAAVLAGAVATGRLTSLGGAAVKRGTKMAGSSSLLETVAPQLGGIASTVRGELANAGKAAAMAVVNNRIESLSDSLHQRTEALRGGTARGAKDSGGEQEEPEDEGDGERGGEPEDSYDGGDEEAAGEPEDSYDGGDEEAADEPEDSYDGGDEEAGGEDEAYQDESGDEAEEPEGGQPDRPRRSPVTRAGR